jgi:hypothetical protein
VRYVAATLLITKNARLLDVDVVQSSRSVLTVQGSLLSPSCYGGSRLL